MTGGNDITEAALWHRWRDGAAEAGRAAAEPDALSLAAYADRRLGRPGIDAEDDPAVASVEAWLADRPDGFDDVMAARAARDDAADAAIIARAQALIATPLGNVVPLRRARSDWRNAVAWSSVAATMLAAVLIGFSLGNDDVIDLSDINANPVAEQVLLGAPASILTTDDEDTGI